MHWDNVMRIMWHDQVKWHHHTSCWGDCGGDQISQLLLLTLSCCWRWWRWFWNEMLDHFLLWKIIRYWVCLITPTFSFVFNKDSLSWFKGPSIFVHPLYLHRCICICTCICVITIAFICCLHPGQPPWMALPPILGAVRFPYKKLTSTTPFLLLLPPLLVILRLQWSSNNHNQHVLVVVAPTLSNPV